jgi:hypothetical protein
MKIGPELYLIEARACYAAEVSRRERKRSTV